MRYFKHIFAAALMLLATEAAFAGSVITQKVVKVKSFINGSSTLNLSGNLNAAAMEAVSSGGEMAIYNCLDDYLVFPTLLNETKSSFSSKTKTRNVSISRKNGKFQWTEKDVSSRYAFAAGDERVKPDKATFKSSGMLSGTAVSEIEGKKVTVYDQLSADSGHKFVGSLVFTPEKKGKNYKFNYNGNGFQAKVSINSNGKAKAAYKLPADVAYPAYLESEYVYTNLYDYTFGQIGEGKVEHGFIGPDQVEFFVTENADKFRFFSCNGIRMAGNFLGLELTEDTFVTAVFGTCDFSLKIWGNGSASYEFTGPDEVTVTAPQNGSNFRYFTVNGERCADNPMTLSLREDTEVLAVFGTYAFKTGVVGDGSLDFEFIEPNIVEVKVPEDSGLFRYLSVNGVCCTDKTMLLTLREDTEVQAVFGTYAFRTEVVGNGAVEHEFLGPDLVEVRASENIGYLRYFTVNGEIRKNATTLLLYLREDTVAEAVFGTYGFSLDIVGVGQASFEFTGQDEVDIKVTEGSDLFRYFSVNGKKYTDSAVLLSLERYTKVLAVFGTYHFSAEAVGEGSVNYAFIDSDKVNVEAKAGDSAFRFFEVNGEKRIDNPLTISLEEDTSVKAFFGTYALSVEVVGNGSVEVEFTDQDTATVTACNGADEFQDFSWDGNVSRESSLILELTKDTVVTATFVKTSYMVIDISEGHSAKSWPHRISEFGPNLESEACRTTELWLKFVPASVFGMGSPKDEIGRGRREDPHRVTLTKGFYIGVFELTRKQYKLITGSEPYLDPFLFVPAEESDFVPAASVHFYTLGGTDKGANWPANDDVDDDSVMGILRAKTGLRFDLPTEAQWECACRATTTSAFNTGNNIGDKGFDLRDYAYYKLNTNRPMIVGQKPPNLLGLYDMHGNVWEWCLDWYTNNLGTDPVVDPVGLETGEQKTLRGGSFDNNPEECRSAYRAHTEPNHSANRFGFRPVVNQ